MIATTRKLIVFLWNFIFDHEVSPLRNIPDVAVRHYILQLLGVMWAISFSIAIGSYTFMAISIIGHTILIAAVAITAATWTTASINPDLFIRNSSKRDDDNNM
jgi:hypothetical protein